MGRRCQHFDFLAIVPEAMEDLPLKYLINSLNRKIPTVLVPCPETVTNMNLIFGHSIIVSHPNAQPYSVGLPYGPAPGAGETT